VTGIKSDIFDKLTIQLQTLTWAKQVNWQRIRLAISDLGDHEIPLIQFYCIRTDYTHEQQRILASSQIGIEVVLKQTQAGLINQKTLFDYMEEVEQCVGAKPNLGVPTMLHMKYLSDETDLHMIEPYYYGLLVFEALYYKRYNNLC